MSVKLPSLIRNFCCILRLGAWNLLKQETTKQVTRLTRGESKALLDELQSFIKKLMFWEILETTSITAKMEFNVTKKYAVITRSIKSYVEHIAPNDALKIIVEESTRWLPITRFDKTLMNFQLHPIRIQQLLLIKIWEFAKANYLKTL